jgi:uncharacterized repeat protein (TIGR03803 family)
MKRIQLLTLARLALILAATSLAQAQSYSVLYDFGTQANDPETPSYSGIIAQGRDGNLYSTAPEGGANSEGAAFKITPAGTISVLYSFSGSSPQPYGPHGGLTLAIDGNFYGTTTYGGSSEGGTIFRLTSSGTLTVLHNFDTNTGAYFPYAPPIQGTDENFYGTTSSGAIYKLTPSGTFTILYSAQDVQIYGPLVQGVDGNLYGTEYNGGTNSDGAVFKISTSGTLSVLYNFDDTHGQYPYGPLVQDTAGNFYGTTYSGGTGGYGVVFEITPSGHLSVLHNFTGSDGEYVYAGLMQASDGNLYGDASSGGSSGSYGSLFRISPSGSGFEVLNNFTESDGAEPEVTPMQNTDGVVFGDTRIGGTQGPGVFYELKGGKLRPFVGFLPPLNSGKVGTTIQLFGQGFTGTTVVSFNGTKAKFTYVSNTYITATVPNGATTGPVIVTRPSGKLTSYKDFRVIPQLTSFSPTSGKVGTVVKISGVSLTQTTKVTFGGVAAKFTVKSDKAVTATVPAGAATGHVAITTLGGTAVSKGVFTVK